MTDQTDREIAVGRLMVAFAVGWKSPTRRAFLTRHPEAMRREVEKMIEAAEDKPPLPPPGPDEFIEKGFGRPKETP